MSKSTVYIALVLLIFWTGLIGGGNYYVIGTTARQYQARNFDKTLCKIAVSEIGEHAMFHSGINIKYSYVVNKKEFSGTRYRYDDEYSSVPGSEIARRYPLKSEQAVYYNPKDPADAVLATGIEGVDLMLILFALPVNVALLLLWGWIIERLREKWGALEAGGVRVRRQEGKIRVRLSGMSAPTAAFCALGTVSFAATFPVVVMNGLAPGLKVMECVLGGVLAVTAVVFCWIAFRNASGKLDLLIDEKLQTLTLPQTGRRLESITYAKAEISGVCIQRRVSRLSSGSFYSYLPAVERAGRQTEALAAFGWTEEKARAFSQWLGQQLGLEFRGVEEE